MLHKAVVVPFLQPQRLSSQPIRLLSEPLRQTDRIVLLSLLTPYDPIPELLRLAPLQTLAVPLSVYLIGYQNVLLLEIAQAKLLRNGLSALTQLLNQTVFYAEQTARELSVVLNPIFQH